jgi:hypothetical protein
MEEDNQYDIEAAESEVENLLCSGHLQPEDL